VIETVAVTRKTLRRAGGCLHRSAPRRRVPRRVTTENDDVFAQARGGCEDPVIAVAMAAGWWGEAAERGEKLEGREDEDRAAVAVGRGGW